MTAAALLAGWTVATVASCAAAALVLRLRACAELVARASHEIRGPLTAAGLALEAIARDGEAPLDRVVALEGQLHRLRLAVEDLTGAPARRRAPDRARVLSAGEVATDVATAWAPVAIAQGRRLSVSDLSARTTIFADPVRLAQATGNLVANALEHGGGEVQLRVRSLGDRVRIEVRDGGRGLRAPIADLVAGARAGRGRRGRGLAIAAEIAERHGGRLVASPSARGAALALELPTVDAGAEEADACGPAPALELPTVDAGAEEERA